MPDSLESVREVHEAAVEEYKAAAQAIEEFDAEAEDAPDFDSLKATFDAAEESFKASGEAFELAKRTQEAREVAIPKGGDVRVKKEPLTYERNNGNSIFSDMLRVETGVAPDAQARLSRHIEEMRVEREAEYDLSSTDSAGGHLVAPLYLNEEFGAYARASRPAVDAIQEKQRQQLSGFKQKTQWLSTLTQISPVIDCLFSNELLDAFPVHLINTHDGTINEIYVNVENDEIYKVYKECRPEVINYLSEFGITLPQDYRTEVNLDLKNWLNDVAITLSEGFIFTIDYGYTAAEYYSPVRNRGTLLCYSRHQAHDNPYKNAGEQDISAHVNFSAVKKWGETSAS